jgi:hypothetical protein
LEGKGGPRFRGSCGRPCIKIFASLQQAKTLCNTGARSGVWYLVGNSFLQRLSQETQLRYSWPKTTSRAKAKISFFCWIMQESKLACFCASSRSNLISWHLSGSPPRPLFSSRNKFLCQKQGEDSFKTHVLSLSAVVELIGLCIHPFG